MLEVAVRLAFGAKTEAEEWEMSESYDYEIREGCGSGLGHRLSVLPEV